MTTYQSSAILKELKNLIAFTCRNRLSRPELVDSFHRALLKKYFNAGEVVVNHQKQEIFMTLPVNDGKGFIPINLEVGNLEGFFKSCIEEDLRSLAFYQNMLGYYTIIAEAS